MVLTIQIIKTWVYDSNDDDSNDDDSNDDDSNDDDSNDDDSDDDDSDDDDSNDDDSDDSDDSNGDDDDSDSDYSESDDKSYDRYTFYLANSYRDQGNYQEAIKFYKKRIELGGWVEEIWFSHYSIGKCFQKMGQPSDPYFTG